MASNKAAAQSGFDDNDEDSSAQMEVEEGQGMVVDLTNYSENAAEYPVLSKGLYPAELYELTYGQSNRSGNNMWTTIWEIDQEDDKGRKPRVYLHLTFNEGGLPRVKRFLSRIVLEDDNKGFNLELLSGPFNPEQIADEGRLVGARATLRIDKRRYEGRWTNQVREVLALQAPSGGGDGSSGFSRL